MAIKWKALGATLPQTQLEQSHASACQLDKLKVSEDCLFYKKGFGTVEYLPLSDLRRAYRRQEESRAIMGCCPQYILNHYLAVVTSDGSIRKFEVERKEQVEKALELLKQAAPHMEFGFVKP
ncbi:MAG: hypothetical protein IJD21_03870 [Oscillospiraceae bacterium]|nr:hypothetical protein [Oscillospiraceae bacterium]